MGFLLRCGSHVEAQRGKANDSLEEMNSINEVRIKQILTGVRSIQMFVAEKVQPEPGADKLKQGFSLHPFSEFARDLR
jgi:hypothetical protein